MRILKKEQLDNQLQKQNYWLQILQYKASSRYWSWFICLKNSTVEIGKHDLIGDTVLKRVILKSQNPEMGRIGKVNEHLCSTSITEKKVQAVQRMVTLHAYKVFQLLSGDNHFTNLNFLHDIYVYYSSSFIGD